MQGYCISNIAKIKLIYKKVVGVEFLQFILGKKRVELNNSRQRQTMFIISSASHSSCCAASDWIPLQNFCHRRGRRTFPHHCASPSGAFSDVPSA